MPKLQFSERPALFASLLPYYLRWAWRFAVAGALVYGVFVFLDFLDVLEVSGSALLAAIIVVALIGAVLSVKHRLLRLHNTRYLFYDTHVVRETKLITIRKQSMPYTHINKVTNNSSLWQRLIGVSDIILHSSRTAENDLVLSSVRDPDAVEHRIYKLLKQGKAEKESLREEDA